MKVKRLIPDISVKGLDLLNYLAVEGEKLQSNVSHLWFATGPLAPLGMNWKDQHSLHVSWSNQEIPCYDMRATALSKDINMLL